MQPLLLCSHGGGWVFVRLSSRPARPLPGPLPWPAPQALRPPSVDQRSMGPGGRQGQGKIKGVPRDKCGLLGQKQRRRDGETETLRLGWRPPDIKTGWCGAPETWGHRERETWGSGDGAPWCPDSQGQTCREGGRTGGGGGPTGPGQGDREGRSGRQRPRDGRDACLHARDAGGERGSRARSADPTAPRYNVSGGGGGELKASGREIKTNTEMRGANRGWEQGGGV